MTDPVYQEYVWLEYQQQQAQTEQERQRAERLAAQCRALDIDPDGV